MNYIGMNLVAIIAATVVGLLIGAAYLSLGGSRRGLEGRSVIGRGLVAVGAEFWLASILAGALILAPVQADAWTVAIGTAVVIWIGFVVPVVATSYSFRGLTVSTLVLDGLHWLVVMVAQAAILHLIGLARP